VLSGLVCTTVSPHASTAARYRDGSSH
jgi:hypothetical protein